MTPSGRSGSFFVRNPITGKKRRFNDEEKARQAAAALAAWVDKERKILLLDHGRSTIGALVDRWEQDRLQFMPWDTGTRRNMLAKMRRIKRELGTRTIASTDRMFIEDWLSSFCQTADQFNDWRYALVLLWQLAVVRKLSDFCEPELVPARSTSKKLEMNRKRRRRLDVEGFQDIHKMAPAWLQLAMEQSLVTLQPRLEICNLQHTHYHDGYLFVIRDKVSGDSDMAFIKIAMTDQLDDIRRRSLMLDSIASPFVIHRAPERRRRGWTEGKPHWTYVNPDYLSKGFAEARDKIERFSSMPARERPTFHEIRSLGARSYRKFGVSEEAIQALMTHAHKRTTQIYLDHGETALTDDDYVSVTATLRLDDLR
jgi:integrase